MKKNTLIKNAFIITITSFILRTFGIVIRSYMSNKIGAEGMGLYQLIVSIYVLATTFVTAGIQTAVIRLVTDAIARHENNSYIKKIMIKSMAISLVISTVAIILFYSLAESISLFWLKDARCISSIKMLVWVLPFISCSSCIKGYFIAKRRVITNSASQLFEQFIRIGCIFIFLEFFIENDLEKICLYVILSDIISEIVAWIFLYSKYKKEIKNTSIKGYTGFELRDFFQISFPIAINRYMTSILRTIENILIPNKLALFTLSRDVALAQFGYLKGMALPLTFFPASFLTAISTLLMPETAEAATLKQENKISKMVEKTFQFTITSAVLISMLFFSYSNEIGKIFYSNEEVSFYIKWLAPLIPFMYLESAIAGMMQGLNQQKKALKYSIIDSILRISLIILILPKYGIKGFLFVMYVSNIVTSCLNAYRVLKISKLNFKINLWLVKPLVSVISSYIACSIVCEYIIISNRILDIIFKISVVSSIYVCMLFMFGIIKKESIKIFR